MNRNLALAAIFAVLLAIVAVLVYLNFFAAPRHPPRREAATASAKATATAAKTSAKGAKATASATPGPARTQVAAASAGVGTASPAGRRTSIVLYFQGPDDSVLFAEEREISDPGEGNARARAVLEELARGPRKELLPTLPQGTRVREVYFDAAGIAYIDFSREFHDNHPGGSSEELMTVDSVIHTLVRNLPQIRAVQFLIEGHPVTTLAGHVNLGEPLRPSADRLAAKP